MCTGLKRVLCLMAAVCQFFCSNVSSFASQSTTTAVESDDAIAVRVKTGMILEVEFPEKIANVTKSVSNDSLQIETLGNKIFLLPLKELDTALYVITQDNISYCLHLFMDETQAPTRMKLGKTKEKLISPEDKKEAANTSEVMKALISGRQPQGWALSDLHNLQIFNNGQFRMTLDKVYEVQGGAKALVATMENLMDKPIVLPIENIELPGLLAISADSQMLEACPRTLNQESSKSSTKAYMVIQEQGT